MSPESHRRVQEEGRWYPTRYRTTNSSYSQEQRILDCSEDENEFDPLRVLTQEEDEEGPEISETECDRELKMHSKTKGNNSLRVAMPPECQQAALTALAVH